MPMGRCASGDHAADCAQDAACQTSSAGEQQRVSNMQAGHGTGTCKHKCRTFCGIQLLLPGEVRTCHPCQQHQHTHTYTHTFLALGLLNAALPLRLLLPDCLTACCCQDGTTCCCCCPARMDSRLAAAAAAAARLGEAFMRSMWRAAAAASRGALLLRCGPCITHHHMHSLRKKDSSGQV